MPCNISHQWQGTLKSRTWRIVKKQRQQSNLSGRGHGRETPVPVYHCTMLPQKHQAAEVPWTLWVLIIVYASMKKINNNTCLSCLFLIKKPRGLGTSDCSWFAFVFLKFKTITKLNEMLNTVNIASMLQGKNPPPLVKDLNYIWNMSWSWIIHRTVLYWHRNWAGRIHPPYCFKV